MGSNRKWESHARQVAVALAGMLLFAGPAKARSQNAGKFKYAGGMQLMARGCPGTLELRADRLTFRCPEGTISVPYASITLMQYRPSVSSKVHKLHIQWQVDPAGSLPIIGHKHNKFFAIAYTDGGKPQGLILEVAPQTMQPYLAEIELQSSKRVEVYSHEEY